jgi:hypothetical protein
LHSLALLHSYLFVCTNTSNQLTAVVLALQSNTVDKVRIDEVSALQPPDEYFASFKHLELLHGYAGP